MRHLNFWLIVALGGSEDETESGPDGSTNVMPKRRADIPPQAAAKKTASLEALDLLPAQIAVLDPQGGIVFTNQVWDETAEGRLARRQWNYLEECSAAAARGCSEGRIVGEGIARILRHELGQFVATYSCPSDRQHHWFQISVRPARASDKGIGAIVMHTDVTALQHDHLTGLANRALFDSQAQYALDTARQNASRFGLALIDLDGLKPINDQFGHAAGDKVLVEIARRLSSAANGNAMVARLGGDEFGVVTWLGCDEVALGRLARKIGLAFKQPYLVGGSKCYLSASIGTLGWLLLSVKRHDNVKTRLDLFAEQEGHMTPIGPISYELKCCTKVGWEVRSC